MKDFTARLIIWAVLLLAAALLSGVSVEVYERINELEGFWWGFTVVFHFVTIVGAVFCMFAAFAALFVPGDSAEKDAE